MTTLTPDEKAILHANPDPRLAAEASRLLIEAYLDDPEDVDWDDIQRALDVALRAFSLPEDFPEQVAERSFDA